MSKNDADHTTGSAKEDSPIETQALRSHKTPGESGGVESKYLPPWDESDLPPPPVMRGWKLWAGLLGPGVVLAGTSIGTGEWLFGPGVSAQYGASLLWLAMTSIVLQVFCNLIVMRYAIYCGEPIVVGVLRSKPGPVFWMGVFVILEFPSLFPYNASNAAVPLTSLFMGHLPATEGDKLIVKFVGIAIFLLAFVPLIFGGTVYKMLEKVMTFKLVVVLGYLSLIAFFMVSGKVWKDVSTGFVRAGTVPLLADSLVAGRHFRMKDALQKTTYTLKGTWEKDGTATGTFEFSTGDKTGKLDLQSKDQPKWFSEEDPKVLQRLLAMSKFGLGNNRFWMKVLPKGGREFVAEGVITDHHYWNLEKVVFGSGDNTQEFTQLSDVPEEERKLLANYLEHEGLAYVNLVSYYAKHKEVPPLNLPLILSFIAIAGAGGMTNSMFSNYARDKGWGMGKLVGAIPSAFGKMTIGLSHTGCAFAETPENTGRWKGWYRHIMRDQFIWGAASVVGMALPCMMSLEFIRNATVQGDRVAAMSAEGIAERYSSFGTMFWFMTLFTGFLVLAPGQVSVADQIARRWTDMIWSASPKVKSKGPGNVKTLYYSLLVVYGVIGLVILWNLSALEVAQASAVMQNVALGCIALMGLYVNRTLVRPAQRPGFLLQAGAIVCGTFFIGISLYLLVQLLWK